MPTNYSYKNAVFTLAITDHLEGPLDRPSAEVYGETAELVRLADTLGVRYAWFAEHHIHAHRGHLPTPLLLALHLAGMTRRIHLGMAVTCLNLHPPLDIAEQVAVADHLMNGRLAPGFGSGATPMEATWLGVEDATDEPERHRRFETSLNIIRAAWEGSGGAGTHTFLPKPATDLRKRTWIAVNSEGAAQIAGRFGGNILFSHLRTPMQHNQYAAAYCAAGGAGLIAMNRPIYVGHDDAAAFAEAEPALRIAWRRFRAEGKIPADTPEPTATADLCAHPLNFIVGGPASVARQLQQLHASCPFDVLNAELRWEGLTHAQVLECLKRLAALIPQL
jgi:alkanesulfonate monooxygenase SsuD/methylene tetrahydromethanopterin reductase-like flavin-dependent oxidoreductase (luciferase family)